ncbi:RNA methyltransferase [Macleaya cordata]|uniref:RNA methyltransferase n=1 Tax=Macleaya cordata TaxID=56857 RepID=A0A200QGE0_MACCD|nr:RNA methyltransferase [Macleaya cordata]
MVLLLFSIQQPSSSSLITSRLAQCSVRTQTASPPPQSLSLNPNNTNNPIPDPSLTCALQCQHFDSCSGCSHEWNLHRPLILDEATDFFSNLGVSNFTFDTCRLWGWRCRAKLAVRGTSMNPLIGLYQEGTHNVVDIPFCRAHHPNINAAVELLRQGIIELDVEPYDEDEGTGELRYVQMAVTTYNTSLPAAERYRNGKVQVALVWNSRNENSPSSEKLNALANFLWRNSGSSSKVHLIHSVWVNFQTSTNNIIFGNRWRHLLGERDFWEHVGGIDISLAPSSFGQANTRAFDSLLQKLHKYVPYGASVTDLYAGAGAIGLSVAVARKCRSVKCIEINKESKLSFEKTVSRLPKHVDSNISWHHADTSIEPFSWLEGSDVVVVDPPRKGLDPSLIDVLRNLASYARKAKASESAVLKVKEEKRPWILREREASIQIESKTTWEKSQSLPETLIYISCGWESFKEDCRSLLSSKRWHLEKAHGFNFFPGTESIEVLAVFKRASGGSVKKKKTGKKKKKKKSQKGDTLKDERQKKEPSFSL